MKRYRLKIPEMIRRKDARLAFNLQHTVNVTVLKDEDPIRDESRVRCDAGEFYVPDKWLEEMPDEPMSAEEWFEKEYGSQTDEDNKLFAPYSIFAYERGVEDGASESEKKHRLKQTLKEAWDDAPSNRVGFKGGWQAHAKATNTEA